MLLTILNLPYTVTYNDLKSLVYSKCGISDCILDNLTPHENRTKKVTIGLSGDEDAAIFMKKINGIMMNGHKLQVVPKNKNPMPSNMNQGPSFMPQGSSWGPQLNLKPPSGMNNQGVPTMVPAPGVMMEPYGGANNIYYPNQHAYYMMNQPAFPTPPTGPNIGYQTLPFGNMGNQGFSQNSWSDNNWNQQLASGGPQPKKEQTGKWGNGGSKLNNRGSRWDNNESNWDNNESNWDNNESKWDNNESKWDNNESKWDNDESKWDNNESKWDNNESNWENKESKWDNNDPKWENNDSNWRNNPEPKRENNRESRWDYNNSSDWDDYRGPRSNNSNDSKWQSNRNSNRDSYGPNQSAGSSRDQNKSYRRNDQNNSPRSSQNVKRNPVTYSSGNRYNQGDNEPQQNRFKLERQRSPHNRDRYQSPPQNRPRNTKPDFVRGGSADKRGDRIPTESQVKLARMWRGKFVFTKANQIMSDPIFEYDAPNPAKLLKALQVEIRKRLKVIITDDYPMRIEQLDKEYKKLYGYKSNWEVLRDSLQKTGGQMLSKMETEPVTMPPLFKKKIKNKKPQQGPKIPQAPLPFGMFGNLKVDHRFEKHGASAGPSQANKRIWPRYFEAKGVPLAMIPGRIPQYPWGDKSLYKRQKRDQNEMMAGDLCGKMFDPMKPEMKKAIEDEVESFCANMLQTCDNPKGDPKIELFCDSLKTGVPPELKRALRLNLARRMLPVLPIKIRVHASPVVKRLPLEEFLKDFNVSTLMKSAKQPYYVADVNTIAEHDKLCTMEPVKIGNSVVHFKPFHMFDMQKQKKDVEQRRLQTAKDLTEMTGNDGNEGGPANNEGGNNKDNDDQTAENACYNLIKNESLCKKMKFIHERINRLNHNIELEEDNEEYHENEEAIEEVYLTGKQFTDNQDFTDDVDVDYVLDSPKGGSARKREDAKIQEESDKKCIAETIEMTDVNDDDLEDY